MLSKQSQYVLRALSCLANTSEMMDIKTIAKKEKIPLHFLAILMQDLARKKIVSSKKGKNGGFYLTEKQKSISLFEVISIYDGVDKFTSCGMGFQKCSEKSPCALHYYYKRFRDQLFQMLRSKKIKDLIKKN
mgnify:CR=1 FL=1